MNMNRSKNSTCISPAVSTVHLAESRGNTPQSHRPPRRLPVYPKHKIRCIHRRCTKEQLWDDSDYISSGYMDILIDQLTSYYDRHGTYPATYLEMQGCPEYDSGVSLFSADDGPTSGQAVKYQYDADGEMLIIRLKTSDTPSPETRGDWSWMEHERVTRRFTIYCHTVISRLLSSNLPGERPVTPITNCLFLSKSIR